jgi:predicted nucleic acid-binding protein
MSAEQRLIYVDSSALVKLAVAEPESKALRRSSPVAAPA